MGIHNYHFIKGSLGHGNKTKTDTNGQQTRAHFRDLNIHNDLVLAMRYLRLLFSHFPADTFESNDVFSINLTVASH